MGALKIIVSIQKKPNIHGILKECYYFIRQHTNYFRKNWEDQEIL